MNTPNPNRNPEYIARIFSQFVRALIQFLIWATLGLASVAAAYLAVRAILVAVRMGLKALGI